MTTAPVEPVEFVEARAPGRVNLIGEHTDYNGGFVLPMAIHLGATARVQRRADYRLVIRSKQVPGEQWECDDIRALTPQACSGWVSYVAGAVWALSRRTAPACGLTIDVSGDVPLGAGLSSSAALECAVVTAVDCMWECGLEPRELARIAQEAENDFVGVPTGSMDQVASMLGRDGSALFYDVLADQVTEVPLGLAELDLELLVIDTRAAHALVDGGYAARRADCEQAAAALGIGYLREVVDMNASLDALAVLPRGDVLVRRARHVVTENLRVRATVDALERRDFDEVGRLMVSSHMSLRDDYEVSCPELDRAVEAALSAGALGARMTGGGFGGSALALLARADHDAVCSAVAGAYAQAGWHPPVFHVVRPTTGSAVVSPAAAAPVNM